MPIPIMEDATSANLTVPQNTLRASHAAQPARSNPTINYIPGTPLQIPGGNVASPNINDGNNLGVPQNFNVSFNAPQQPRQNPTIAYVPGTAAYACLWG